MYQSNSTIRKRLTKIRLQRYHKTIWRIERAFVVNIELFLARLGAVADSKMLLIELAESQGHFVEAGVHFAEDCVGFVFAGG